MSKFDDYKARFLIRWIKGQSAFFDLPLHYKILELKESARTSSTLRGKQCSLDPLLQLLYFEFVILKLFINDQLGERSYVPNDDSLNIFEKSNDS